ncbi:alcohol dehydrogenase catalytic domain-containing protein [Acrocarpospora sp. B8E8]|uniref:alcohol dehydrogenase catalytic domain-containing protein n=1 Tax=Acrocarpospora sp. B8E8 TaxID=3153572 RepID=UPI00325CACB8
MIFIEMPVPVPGPGQIQVRIAAAFINAVDINAPGGAFGDLVTLEFPHVLGQDFAGTVTQVGPGATGYRPGDDVFGFALPRALRPLTGSRPSLSSGTGWERHPT